VIFFDFLQSDWLQQRAAFYDILTVVQNCYFLAKKTRSEDQGRRNWGAAAPVALYQEGQGGQRCPFNLKDCLGEIANCQKLSVQLANCSELSVQLFYEFASENARNAVIELNSRIAQSPGGEPLHTPIIQ
jgi:hypothetical protein